MGEKAKDSAADREDADGWNKPCQNKDLGTSHCSGKLVEELQQMEYVA